MQADLKKRFCVETKAIDDLGKMRVKNDSTEGQFSRTWWETQLLGIDRIIKYAPIYLRLDHVQLKLQKVEQEQKESLSKGEKITQDTERESIPGLSCQLSDSEKEDERSDSNLQIVPRSSQSFFEEQIKTFSQEDMLNAQTGDWRQSDSEIRDSDVRTVSHVSEQREVDSEEDDYLSEPDIADTFQKNKRIVINESKHGPSSGANRTLTYKKLRKRQVKELAKFHARDIIAFKINKKLAEQAAAAA